MDSFVRRPTTTTRRPTTTTTRRMARLAAVALVGVAGLAACGSDDSGESGDLTGTTWVLTELDGEPLPDGVTVDLTFDGERVAGSSGCNQYNSAATFEDGAVSVEPAIASTMMACEQPAMDVEVAYLTALTEVTTYTVEGSTLMLADSDDVIRASFAG